MRCPVTREARRCDACRAGRRGRRTGRAVARARRLAGHPELPAPRRPGRRLRSPFRRQPAVHAGAARHPDRTPQFPASRLGSARAVRPFDRRDPARARRLHAPDHRPLSLLRGRRHRLPRPLLVVGVHPRPGEGQVAAARCGRRRRALRRALRRARSTTSRPDINAQAAVLRQPRATSRRRGAVPARRSASTPPTRSSRDHHADDDWFLHLECFDPHEPFFAPERFLPRRCRLRSAARSSTGRATARADLDPALLAQLRGNYYALVAACDEQLGTPARHVRPPRPVARHLARAVDRPRAAARREGVPRQEPAAVLQRGGAHPAADRAAAAHRHRAAARRRR